MKFRVIILLSFIVIIYGCDVKQSPNNASPEEIAQNVKSRNVDTTAVKKANEQSKKITYTVFRSWSIPNGGYGKIILIDRALFNEADMRALGKKLRDDAINDRNAAVFVYDDKKAINLRDRYIAMKTTASEEQFYEKHLLAQYNKNGNTGYHEYKIYLWGFMNDRYITVKY
jgi:hypothetical protein